MQRPCTGRAQGRVVPCGSQHGRGLLYLLRRVGGKGVDCKALLIGEDR